MEHSPLDKSRKPEYDIAWGPLEKQKRKDIKTQHFFSSFGKHGRPGKDFPSDREILLHCTRAPFLPGAVELFLKLVNLNR